MTEMKNINNMAIESAFGGILIPLDGDDLQETREGLIHLIHTDARRKQRNREENEKMVSHEYPLAAGIQPSGKSA